MDNYKSSNKINSNGVVTLKPRREIVIEELQTEFDKQLDKIALINDFMALHGRKNEIVGDLTLLKNKTVELKQFLRDARQKIEIFKSVQLSQTRSLIENMRKQNLKMLEMLETDDMDEGCSYSSSNEGYFPFKSVFVSPKKNNYRTSFQITMIHRRFRPHQKYRAGKHLWWLQK